MLSVRNTERRREYMRVFMFVCECVVFCFLLYHTETFVVIAHVPSTLNDDECVFSAIFFFFFGSNSQSYNEHISTGTKSEHCFTIYVLSTIHTGFVHNMQSTSKPFANKTF